ncbi:type VI secretion system tube protein Hcp [Paraburkholderia sp. SOS3]|uniref:type VI secretion system tube protein Hcp n=1 Tax=Paraburkholderia sp. SOS3 TaxID=1926494 RepID=UPI000A3E735A|nr:type VI secretion system tube protein Hcp [Paraburkholderia sp. SOS3]
MSDIFVKVPKVVLSMRKAGGVPVDFLKITVRNVIITSVEPIIVGASYCEHVGLSFSRVQQEYTLQNPRGGNAGTIAASFDINENAER